MRRTTLMSLLSAFVAFFVIGTTSAWAQSYYSVTQAPVGTKWVTVPSSGTSQIMGSGIDSGIYSVTTPFPIPYWGSNYNACQVSSDGYMQFGSAGISSYIWSPISLPVTSGATNDGHVAVCCTDCYSGNSAGKCVWWVDGVQPNRRFIVAWVSWDVFASSYGGYANFEAQFGENGIIVFSYLPNSSWNALVSGENTAGAGVGLDKPGDSTQFIKPTTLTGATSPGVFVTPQYDYQFSALQITGRVLFDRYVTDASGIGNTSEYGLPLSGMTVAELDSNGGIVGTGVTDATGAFTVFGSPVANGSLAVLSGSTACNVRKSASGALYQAKFVTNYDFTQPSPIAVGTVTLNEALDPGGVNRAPINIARTIQTVYDWAKQRAPTKTFALVDPVLYDVTSAAPTSFTQKNGTTTPASMRVASPAAGNGDAWDVSVLRKVYARQILGGLAADPGAPYDATFDAATSDVNAFAEAWGYYLNAIVSRDTKYFDGVNGTTTNVLDMETPPLSSAKGTNVAGWLAAAMYDLVDGVDLNVEPWDTFDGTGIAGEQAFNTVASMPANTPVTSTLFFNAWVAKGYDGTALARDFIHHGALVDDADEPNDFASEATPLTQFGFVRTNRVLNQFNDDYYKFTMAYPTSVLTVDCVYDRSKYASAVVLLELQNASGGVVGTGSPTGLGGPIEFKSGALPAGTYLVHLKLNAGGPIPVYTVQAYSQLAFISGSFEPWTVGRPINVPVNVTGGIPPYNLAVLTPFVKPDGLILDGVNAKVAGTPTGPQTIPIPLGGSYTYNFILSAQDAASPVANTASGPVSFTVNDALKVHFAPYFAFPFSKPVDVRVPFTGGTPPYTASYTGALPHGLMPVDGASLRITGTPDSPGSYAFTFTGTDHCGSADTGSTVGVACVPLGQAALAPGDSACGFYVDVVKGSTVALTITTVPTKGTRKAPRALRITTLDRDGSTVLVRAKDKATKGKATTNVFTAPSTGRFYFVVASDDAGGQAILQAKAKIVADKGGSGDSGSNSFVSPDTLPVEIGAIGGATLTFTAKPSKGSGLQLRGAYLLDPAGNILLFAEGEVSERADGSITFRRVLPTSGTWTIVVGAKPGPQGRFSYAFSLKEPKGVYSAD